MFIIRKNTFHGISYSSHEVISILSSRVEKKFNSLSTRLLRLMSDSKEKNHFFHAHHTKKHIFLVLITLGPFRQCIFTGILVVFYVLVFFYFNRHVPLCQLKKSMQSKNTILKKYTVIGLKKS